MHIANCDATGLFRAAIADHHMIAVYENPLINGADH